MGFRLERERNRNREKERREEGWRTKQRG